MPTASQATRLSQLETARPGFVIVTLCPGCGREVLRSEARQEPPPCGQHTPPPPPSPRDIVITRSYALPAAA